MANRDARGRFVSNNTKENKTMNRQNRLDALNNANVNTQGFYNATLQVPVGAELTVMVNGKQYTMEEIQGGVLNNLNAEKVSVNGVDVDTQYIQSLIDSINGNGYIKNAKLWRRWVTAQTFRALNYKGHGYRKGGWTDYLNDHHNYRYQFTMLIDELNTQHHLDSWSFKIRNHFFNGDVAVALLEDYKGKVEEYARKSAHENRKYGIYSVLGRYGYVLKGDVRYLTDVDMYIRLIKDTSYTNTREIAKILKQFLSQTYVTNLPSGTEKCKEWIDAYKGVGGYESIKNLVMWHGITLGKGSIKEDVDYLTHRTFELDNGEFYTLLGWLKAIIRENNFDFKESCSRTYGKQRDVIDTLYK